MYGTKVVSYQFGWSRRLYHQFQAQPSLQPRSHHDPHRCFGFCRRLPSFLWWMRHHQDRRWQGWFRYLGADSADPGLYRPRLLRDVGLPVLSRRRHPRHCLHRPVRSGHQRCVLPHQAALDAVEAHMTSWERPTCIYKLGRFDFLDDTSLPRAIVFLCEKEYCERRIK